nr:MAG TPA: hypothetical protein [Caudoviricetes sp.]
MNALCITFTFSLYHKFLQNQYSLIIFFTIF